MKIKVIFAAAWLLIRVWTGPAGLPAQEAVPRDAAIAEHNTPALSLEQASELEARLAADALRETAAYFRDLGFSLPSEASLKVLFQDPIVIKGQVWDCAHGVFDPDTATIWMIRYDSEQFQSCRLFGLEPRPELYRAILVHEFTHYMNSLVSPGLIPTVDEAIAGTVQFALLEPSLREKILAGYENATGVLEILPVMLEPWYRSWVDALNVQVQKCLRGEISPDVTCDNLIKAIDKAKRKAKV